MSSTTRNIAASGLTRSAVSLAQTRPLNLAAWVRPPANEYFLIAPLLDAGASGVIMPNVQTASDAKKFTDACRYTPRGQRGAGVFRGA